ncbi:hypothetical protein JHK87_012623 [Glycine soja]|nr:hypothetical protein JHK87_012623 [Glycine soja]
MKNYFAFFRSSSADEARYNLDGRDVEGRHITGPCGSQEYLGRGPPTGPGRCFNCGIDDHWARDSKAGHRKNKSYQFGGRGHIEKNCKNSPKKLRNIRGWSLSHSPVRSQSPQPSKVRKHSASPDQSSAQKRGVTSPGSDKLATQQDGSDYSDGPRGKCKSPANLARDRDEGSYDSPKANGHSHSPSHSRIPRDDDRSHIDEDDENHRGYSHLEKHCLIK